MSIVNLEALFTPRSVALVGGTDSPASVGGVLTQNLLAETFGGELYIVNHRRDEVRGRPAYASVSDLPHPPDLGVLAIPAPAVPTVIRELGEAGARAAVVISAGFEELGTEAGRTLNQEMLDAARPHGLRILGPNCVGMIAPHAGMNASFAHLAARPGGLACVSQSGAILTAMLDWAESQEIGFSAMVSLGNAADVDAGDMLDYLALDPETSAILLYLEGLQNARKFASAARAAARSKPVIVVKSGRHESGAAAAASHTAALAGADEVFDAVFRRTGVVRVRSLDQLFDAAEVLSMARPPRGRRVAILTNGGGVGVLAADALLDEGAEMAQLSDATLAALDEILPVTWSRSNPVDIIGDASPERYTGAMGPLIADDGVDVILALNSPTALASSRGAAEAVADASPGPDGPVLVTSWIGEHDAAEARTLLARRGIPSYGMPEQAVRAFMYLDRFRRSQEVLLETPPSVPEAFTPDREAATEVLDRALAEDREWLDEIDSKRLLEAYGVPTVPSFRVETAVQAGEKAREIGRPVAIKVLSPDIVHKSEAGAVLLEVEPRDAEAVASSALERIGRDHPDARITGLSVQPMVDRRNAWELLAGITTDPLFGPIVLFGEGGTAVEVIRDRAIGLPPLNMHLADRLVSRTRIDRRLRGFRHRAAVDREALCFALVKLAQLAADRAEVRELDVNPLIASPEGVVALDARVRVRPGDRAAADRLTIRPYPGELEGTLQARDGETFRLRPLRPEDESAVAALFDGLTREEIRQVFRGAPPRALDHPRIARLVQLDYDREMAWALLPPDDPVFQGLVRVRVHPDLRHAEFAVLVAREVAGRGLGTQLVERAIDYARSRGLRWMAGNVLPDNETMLDLCRRLGFVEADDAGDPSVIRMILDLEHASDSG